MFAALISLTLAQAPTLQQARSLASDVYAGQPATLWQRSADSFKAQVGSQGGLQAMLNGLRGSMGAEVRVITEAVLERPGGTLYRRVSAVTNWARGMELELGFDLKGHLTSVVAKPATKEAPTLSGLHKTRVALRLPFEGSWYVLWGGRSYEDNRHTPVPDMRYAMDVFIVKGPGTFTGAGTRNEDYFAWGQPMLAPGTGRVVAVVTDVSDNAPNAPRPGSLYGNFITIDHGGGEYSLLGHLQKGSVRVKVGDTVVTGEVIARCGNSGMSTEPHLHYQLMDDEDWKRAYGLPAQFLGYVANGRAVQRGEPRRTEVISPLAIEAQRERQPASEALK
jgi:hypothetical protein